MKKLLSVALAMVLAFSAIAQFSLQPRENVAPKSTNSNPIWAQIGTPFVATDIHGNTVDLAAILASGQNVVIDYSCCWCGPCWNMHQSGILEAIDELEDVQVIWCEIETDNGEDELYGRGGSTYGNWTVTSTGAPIEYPIIDDATTLNTCMALYEGYVPSIYFISASGYFCNLYGESYGFGSSTAPATAKANVSALAAMAPRAGVAPVVAINGSEQGLVGMTCNFIGDVVSVDEVTGYSWTFQGATPATATTKDAACVWNTPGTYQVTYAVTNTTGTTTVNMNVTVSEMGTVLAYNQTMPVDPQGNIGINSTTKPVYWAVSFPSSMLANHHTLYRVKSYVSSTYPGNYTMTVYSGSATAPQTQLGQVTLNVTAAMGNQLVAFEPATPITIDQTKDLWIVMNTMNTYPCFGSEYCGIPNSDWISTDGNTWDHAYGDYNFSLSWKIEAHTDASNAQGINTLTNAKVALYPNPTTSKVNVEAEGVQRIDVIDVNGRTVMTQVNGTSVDMSNLSNGMYMFRVITNNGVSMQKVVKE